MDRDVPEALNPNATDAIRWNQILKSIIDENLNNKPTDVYKTLLEVSQLENIILPKKTVRKAIYSMRASIKKKFLCSVGFQSGVNFLICEPHIRHYLDISL